MGINEYDPHQRKGDFGEAVVDVLAIAAGLQVWTPRRDNTGIDRKLKYPGPSGSARYPEIEVQIKTTAVDAWDTPVWRHELTGKHYNMLAGDGHAVPRFLFLVTVPAQVEDWAQVTRGWIAIRHAVYWACFVGEPQTPAISRRVTVPGENLLTADTLLALTKNPWEWRSLTA